MLAPGKSPLLCQKQGRGLSYFPRIKKPTLKRLRYRLGAVWQGFFLISQGKRAVFLLPAGVARLGGVCIFCYAKKQKKLHFFCKGGLTFTNYCER